MWRVKYFEGLFEVCSHESSEISQHICGFSPVPNYSSVGTTQHMQTSRQQTDAFHWDWGFASRVRKWGIGKGSTGCLEETDCNQGSWL